MEYKSASALEMAIKEMAKISPLDTNRAISGFYFHRFLCRVFADNNSAFVLKGGQSVLARTLNARATRDIDLVSAHQSIEEALNNLKLLAQRDLNDFIYFEFKSALPIKNEDDYRSGLSVKFTPIIGSKHMQDISIDLVVDQIPLDDTEKITPVDRIDIKGLQSCDYLVYPVASALSDKFCALIESHNGKASSRVKDLVDIVIYALTCNILGDKLQKQIEREIKVRKLELPETFALPGQWGEAHARQYSKLCSQTGIPTYLHQINVAKTLAGKLFNPVLTDKVAGLFWDHNELAWIKQ